jgi:hypothetical protein
LEKFNIGVLQEQKYLLNFQKNIEICEIYILKYCPFSSSGMLLSKVHFDFKTLTARIQTGENSVPSVYFS